MSSDTQKKQILILSNPDYDSFQLYQEMKNRLNQLVKDSWTNLSIDLSHINPDGNIRRFNDWWIKDFQKRASQADLIIVLGDKNLPILTEAITILETTTPVKYLLNQNEIVHFTL